MIFKEINEETREAALRLSGTFMISRGKRHQLGNLPGYCAIKDEEVQAAIYYNLTEGECELKPSIPMTGYDGLPVRHEIEFEYRFQTVSDTMGNK